MTIPYANLGSALATDYFFVREQFSKAEWDQFRATRRFVEDEVLPVINDYWSARTSRGRWCRGWRSWASSATASTATAAPA
jgi:hypothetical protein